MSEKGVRSLISALFAVSDACVTSWSTLFGYVLVSLFHRIVQDAFAGRHKAFALSRRLNLHTICLSPLDARRCLAVAILRATIHMWRSLFAQAQELVAPCKGSCNNCMPTVQELLRNAPLTSQRLYYGQRPIRTRPLCKIRSFEKGLADRGGWREEILPMPEIEASSLHPFSYAPLGEGGHISGEPFWRFWGVCVSPTPSRQPLFETSDKSNP